MRWSVDFTIKAAVKLAISVLHLSSTTCWKDMPSILRFISSILNDRNPSLWVDNQFISRTKVRCCIWGDSFHVWVRIGPLKLLQNYSFNGEAGVNYLLYNRRYIEIEGRNKDLTSAFKLDHFCYYLHQIKWFDCA